MTPHVLVLCCLVCGLAGMPGSPALAQTAASDSAAALTVTVAPPTRADWPESVTASGWLAPWQEAVVSAEISGQRITAVNVDVGSTVRKGDVLAELSRDSLQNDRVQKQAAVDSAAAALDAARSDGDRARGLTVSGAISQQQITEYLVTERKAKAELAAAEAALASAELDLARSSIAAVDDGVISSRSAALGDVVSTGDELFRLIRQNRIEWQAEVPLRDLRAIGPGTRAVIPTPFGDVEGSVRMVAPTASTASGRVTVYVTLTPPEGAPSPKTGILVSGQLIAGESSALSVPAAAITLRDGFSYLFTLNPGAVPTVSRKRVETGRREADRVEILSGLEEADQVVQAGGAFLGDGSVVRVTQGAVQ